MSAKTKIFVLHMKNLIMTGILIGVIILFIILIALILWPGKSSSAGAFAGFSDSVPSNSNSSATYTPGVYSSTVVLNDSAIDVAVTVDENHINDVAIVNVSESVEAMYPLLEPAMDDLSNQIVSNQSTDNLKFSENNQYTSIVLLDAVNVALEKAKK